MKKKSFKIGIVGATGLVGETFLKLLGPAPYDFSELKLFASPASLGREISFRDRIYKCEVLSEQGFAGLDVVFFSSGDPISKEWAPRAVEQGAIAIDNSAAFRMVPDIPLVVPEINFSAIDQTLFPQIIANPNCSTIQLVMALNVLKPLNLTGVRVASYQSVSGAGKDGIQELKTQSQEALSLKSPTPGSVFNPPIAFDAQPKIGSLDDRGFCSEEVKIMAETQKILAMPDLKVSASTVRIPTFNGHGESLWVTFAEDVSKSHIEGLFEEASYIRYRQDDHKPIFHTYQEVTNQTDAFVSRLRKDPAFENTWMMWVVADNLYRGAAANGLLIAERIFDKLSQP